MEKAKKVGRIEKEASHFALMLLMPEQFFAEDMKGGFDMGSDDYVKKLAKKYGVSMNAILKRAAIYKKYNSIDSTTLK